MTTKAKELKCVGHSELKIDALGLACGLPAYVDDISIPGMLYGKILFSPRAHARIVDIDTAAAEAIPGVKLLLTYKNVPRIVHTTAGQGFPEPSPYDAFMFDSKVRFVGDRVAAVCAESENAAIEALSLIRVTYETLESVFDPEKAVSQGAPVIHDEPEAKAVIPMPYHPENNIAASVEVSVGDIEQGLSEADFVFDERYENHYASHCAMEPHTAIAYFDHTGRIVIRSTTQVPFHARRIAAQVTGLPISRIRIVKPRIGGGFGGKQEVLIEDLAAMMCWRTKKPVRIAYTRRDVFMSARTRHPFRVHLRGGIKKDGAMTAVEMSCLMNTGAYGAHALTVGCNAGSKVLPLFNKIENVRFALKSAYTNLPVGGAYRGYGATQGYFAYGQMIDEMARHIGMDVCDFYQSFAIREGESSPVFELLGEGTAGAKTIISSCGLGECVRLGREAIGWDDKRGKKLGDERFVRGVGMLGMMQGSAIPEIDMASAMLKLNDDGSFNLLIGATDIGTGSDTILAQIAAEVLCTDITKIIVTSSDTDVTPFDTGAYASSTTYLSGMAVLKAAEAIKPRIFAKAATILGVESADGLYLQNGEVHGGSRPVSLAEIGTYSFYTHNQEQIASDASAICHVSPPPFSAHFAEVEVDKMTGRVKILSYVAAVDCGTAVNPLLAEGQSEGAIANGISYAMHEEYIFDDAGAMRNPSFSTYKIASTLDMPPMKVILVPTWEPTGPFGAKSISEIGINGPLPAIANAIYDAVGVRMRKSPFTPERVLAELDKAAK